MSHLIGASATTASSSPPIHANGDRRDGERPNAGAHQNNNNDNNNNNSSSNGRTLPSSGVASLTTALKSLSSLDSGAPGSDKAPAVQYDTPYTRSIPSTAPGSPRM